MNIEQAKDAAAKEFGFNSFRDIPTNHVLIENGAAINRAMEIYAASCIEGERQRILEALPEEQDTTKGAYRSETEHAARYAHNIYRQRVIKIIKTTNQ